MRTLILVGHDGKSVPVEPPVASLSSLIRHMLERHPDISEIPVPRVNGKILERVVEWATHYYNDLRYLDNGESPQEVSVEGMSPWDYDFLMNLKQETLERMANAADILEIKALKKYTVRILAKRMSNLNPRVIHRLFRFVVEGKE